MFGKTSLWIVAGLLAGMSPAGGQTSVTKRIAAKENDYGITYALPKTQLIVRAQIIKTSCKAGAYFRYAEKYLGEKHPVTEDKTSYRLGDVSVINKGIADADNTYIVAFRPGTVAPFACLTEDGLLCSINADYEPIEPTPVASPATEALTAAPALSEELLMAGSIAKQAEVAAKMIYRLRDSRLNILTGEADNLPPDGEAMKLVIRRLEEQEKALTELFVGVCTHETTYYETSLVPYEEIDKETLFRFSERRGATDADDLGGEPVYLSLKVLDDAFTPQVPDKMDKRLKGLVYNVPAKAAVEVRMNNKALYKGETQVVQFGSKESLAPAIFENKKAPVKIFFYPQTGAIRQIFQ